MGEQFRHSLAYVADALTFVFMDRSNVAQKVSAVYLFGSAAREELGPKSDIDLFFDCSKDEESVVKQAALRAIKRFFSSKDFDKWQRLEFVHPISIHTGPLKEWKLRSSILAEGIALFSRPTAPPEYKRNTLFIIEMPPSKRAYLSLTRALFGRKEKLYSKPGLLQELGGQKIGPNIFIIPQPASSKAARFLHSQKVAFSTKEFLAQ